MTGQTLPKDWHAGVIQIGGRLYLQFKEHGRWKQKRTGLVGTPENEVRARALAAELERQIKAEEGLRAVTGGMTLRAYAKDWLAGRTGTSAVDDRQRLEQHVLPVLGDMPLGGITTPMVRDLVNALKKKASQKGGKLAPRTVLNIYGVLQGLLSTAVEDGKVAVSPCKLTGKTLPMKRDKDPTWRDDAIFELWEVLLLLGSELVPWDRRVFYALMFLGCMRFGEAAEQRWKDYDHALKPRGKLKVLRAWNTRVKLVKETKAERPRHVPVVQLLAKILAEWKLHGWMGFYDRLPGPEDLIVPSRTMKNRSANHMLRKFHKDLTRLKLRRRRQHDARRTWFSRVTAEGANETHARWTAWGPPPHLWADYTSMPWETLCSVVDGLEAAIRRAQKTRRRA